MNTQPSTPHTRRLRFGWKSAFAATLAALLVTACGGGGDGGSSGASGGAVSSGPITGFGSVIVNGVRFDDSTASVTDDDGTPMQGKLRLGMLATVKSSPITGASATASSVSVGGELQGPIDGAPNTASKTFVVLGQTVEVTGSTIFDTSLSSGFASLTSGTIVEVHGILNPAANRLQATFIERKNSPSVFKVQGVASAHDPVAKKFSLGSVRITYASAGDVRVVPNNGTLVRVRVQAQTPAPSEWIATRIRPPENNLDDRNEAEITGFITAFTSTAAFSLNGVAVNASNAAFPKGQAGIVAGARVEVKGSIVNGVLVATRVKVEDGNAINALEFEVHGTVSSLSGNTFKVQTVSGGLIDVTFNPAAVTFLRGTATNLVNGARIEVKGVASGGSTSTSITASAIQFES